MATYAQHDASYLSRRAIAFVAIIGLHVLLIYGFATGLAQRAIAVVSAPLQTDIVQEVQKRDEPPPPPPPKMERPPVEVPPPDVAINMPAEPQSTAITNVTTQHVTAPPPAPRAVSRTPGGPGKGFPNTDDYYPPASQRLNEEGSATVKACVDANGKLTEAPAILQTSGSSRLDEGALKLAKAGSGRYKPNLEDGKPVPGCVSFRVKFQLKN